MSLKHSVRAYHGEGKSRSPFALTPRFTPPFVFGLFDGQRETMAKKEVELDEVCLLKCSTGWSDDSTGFRILSLEDFTA